MFFSVVCLLCLCARLFIFALWSPAGKGLTSWLSFVMSNCEFVTFPSGILGQVWYLYRFPIFAPLLTFILILRTAKTLIRLSGCVGSSEPSLGGHAKLFTCCVPANQYSWF